MEIYTIGHSNVDVEKIIELLDDNGIEILVDIRSTPYSKFASQFNGDGFKQRIEQANIEYAFAGNYLGGRPKDPSCYDGDQVSYRKIREKSWYKKGIERLIQIASSQKTAIMCSEESPYQCHRHKLLAQSLLEEGFDVYHIRGNGQLEEAEREPEQLSFL